MKTLFTIWFLVLTLLSVGQTVRLNGFVKDENGRPISYASVYTVHSRHRWGTTTKPDGNFSLLVDVGDSLKFTHLAFSQFGYTVRVGGSVVVSLREAPATVYQIERREITFQNPILYGGKLVTEKLNKDTISKNAEVVKASQKIEDKGLVFDKVELLPVLTGNTRYGLGDSLPHNGAMADNDIREINLNFLINSEGTIDSVYTVGRLRENFIIDSITKSFKTHFRAKPAEQNGHNVAVKCTVPLLLYPNKKTVEIFILEPSKRH